MYKSFCISKKREKNNPDLTSTLFNTRSSTHLNSRLKPKRTLSLRTRNKDSNPKRLSSSSFRTSDFLKSPKNKKLIRKTIVSQRKNELQEQQILDFIGALQNYQENKTSKQPKFTWMNAEETLENRGNQAKITQAKKPENEKFSIMNADSSHKKYLYQSFRESKSQFP